MKITKNAAVILVIMILTVAVIWGNSCVPGSESQQMSDSVKGFFGLLGLDSGSFIVIYIRKFAHMLEYAVLGAEAAILFARSLTVQHIVNSIAICGAVSLIDESIQMFTTRGPLVSDIWIDLSGAAIGIALSVLIMRIVHIRRSKKGNLSSKG